MLPTLISDHLAAAWAALTGEQRSLWRFVAAANPRVTDAGALRTQNGWQYFVAINSALAVIDDALIITTPPTDTTAPPAPTIAANAWPLAAQLSDLSSSQRPAPWITLTGPWPANAAALITQAHTRAVGATTRTPNYRRITTTYGGAMQYITAGDPPEVLTTPEGWTPPIDRARTNTAPRVRHVTVITPNPNPQTSLETPQGYYATTAGLTRYAKIKGQTARRRPDLPLGKIQMVSTDTGARREYSIKNTTARRRSNIRRPRHYP